MKLRKTKHKVVDLVDNLSYDIYKAIAPTSGVTATDMNGEVSVGEAVIETDSVLLLKPGTHLYHLRQKYAKLEVEGFDIPYRTVSFSEKQFDCPIQIIDDSGKRVVIGVFRNFLTSPDKIHLFTTLSTKDNFLFYNKLGSAQKKWKTYIKRRTTQPHNE